MPKWKKFIKNSTEYKKQFNHPFYTLGKMTSTFDDVINFLKNPTPKKYINRNDGGQLTFEYIDCTEKLALPLFYQSLINITQCSKNVEFTEYIYNNYSKYCKKIRDLLNFIRNITDIPMELLSKYYARIYTAEPEDGNHKFYSDLNKDLRENKKEMYLPFIKVLYEGVRLKALPIASHKTLYRGAIISNDEINMIEKYVKQKKENLPGAIVFSRCFLSFSKDKGTALGFIDTDNKNNKLSGVLLELKNDNNIDYSLSTHADIDKISFFDDEGEVLFFPFSTFEISKEIKIIKGTKNKKIYHITLLYLGKYIKEVEKTVNDKKDENKNDIPIPDSKFKNEICEFGLIEKDKANTIKELVHNYHEYKDNIKDNNNNHSELPTNYIKSELNIDNININKKIQIINSYEEFQKNNNILDNNSKYSNEKEIKNNCEIRINGEKIEFSYYHTFNEKGNYKIEYIFKKKIEKINHIFAECNELTNIDLSNFNSQNIKEMNYMFYKCENLTELNLSNFNTENIYNMKYLFYECKSLKELNISSFNTKYVYDMSNMFNGCNSLTNLDLSNFNTINVCYMNRMFSSCNSLKQLDLSNFHAETAIDISCMFSGCNSLINLDLTNFRTKIATDMSFMFDGCNSLVNLDINAFNTDNITNMRNMFKDCYSLEKLNLSNFNTENVTDMSYMFSKCSKLANLDLSNFNTEKVITMKCMFDGCESLKSINLNRFNTKEVTDMGYMFNDCNSLINLDLSNFIVEKVEDMGYMFGHCLNLTNLNISKFNLNIVNNTRFMIYDCQSLKKENIIANDSIKILFGYIQNNVNN